MNCNKPNGFIEEKIYEDVDYDAEELVNKVLAMSEKEVLEKQAGILGTFPNSYTFTKNLGERLIRKYRGDIPLVLIRPSIIGVAMRDPV